MQKSQAEKALKKRKRAVENMEKEYTQTVDWRTVNLLSNLYNNISNTYSALHKQEDSAAALEKAFLIRMQHPELDLAETHDLLQQMMNLINLLITEHRFVDSERVLTSYENIVIEKIGTGSTEYGICQLTHGIVALGQGKASEAERFFLDAEVILRKNTPQGNGYLMSARQYLYTLYRKLGKISLADSYKGKIQDMDNFRKDTQAYSPAKNAQ